jgi:replicative DNA helicase
MSAASNFDPMDNVFDPPQVSALAMRKADDLGKDNDTDKLYTGLPNDFDKYYVMWRRKRITGVLGHTSNYKTGFMTYVAREAAKRLNAEAGEIGLYCTWEDPVEDFALADIANVSNISLGSIYGSGMKPGERDEILKASMKRAASPLWLVGHSEYVNARRPGLTISDIWQALEYIFDKQKKTVKFVVFDYLQQISYADLQGRDMREGFVQMVSRVKDLTNAFGVGVMLGSQVKREIMERKDKQPIITDAAETSNFEYSCDGVISLQIPQKSTPVGTPFMKTQKGDILVSKRLLAVKVLKQKKGATGDVFCYDAKYETNSIDRYTGE